MRRLFRAAVLAAPVVGVFACGSGYNASPTGPNNPPPPGAIVIDIVGINGSRSFFPNPSTVPAGERVVWHNVDSTTHRVVLDDGRVDAGTIAPGAYSAAMTLTAPGPYHCTIHPSMVGTIKGDQ
jgi:plastocyanin